MGDLTYLIIFLVVVNLVGRLFRALQKSAGQQAKDGKTTGSGQQPRSGAKSKDPFSVIAERLEELGQAAKEKVATEEPPPPPYAQAEPEAYAPEVPASETPSAFGLETAATLETEFEEKPRGALHRESFPWEMKREEYAAPTTRPVPPAIELARDYTRSYRSDVVRMLRDRESLRTAIVLETILGPCRARESRYRFRGPR